MSRAFHEAEKLRAQRENVFAHLYGAYIYEALVDASPLFRDFVKRAKPRPYREKPFEIGGQEKNQVEEELIKKNERLRAQLFFRNWARTAAKQFE